MNTRSSFKMELSVGAAVSSGDVKSAVATANRRSDVSGRSVQRDAAVLCPGKHEITLLHGFGAL
ncbi:MAG TPA: hypothetical protein VFS12_10350 [Terriglobia bacterium]|nr:hypothetical protein [Terriglobia bacterium]